MVYQISSEMIGVIAISIPSEDNAAISRDAQLAFVLQRLEEDTVQNLEEKEQIIVRHGELFTMM